MPRLAPVKRKTFEKFLKGDHLIYDRKGLTRPVVITTDSEIPIFIIRNNLRVLKIGHEEYLEILKRLK